MLAQYLMNTMNLCEIQNVYWIRIVRVKKKTKQIHFELL